MQQARRFDTTIGICTCCCLPSVPTSSGIIMTSSNTHFANNLGIARLYDMVMGNCGDSGIIMSASQTCKSDNLGRARVTSFFNGCYSGIIINGSPDVMVGD